MNNKDFDLGIGHIPFQESGLGRISSKMDGQIDELHRIADAAEQRAELAEREAKSAKKRRQVLKNHGRSCSACEHR